MPKGAAMPKAGCAMPSPGLAMRRRAAPWKGSKRPEPEGAVVRSTLDAQRDRPRRLGPRDIRVEETVFCSRLILPDAVPCLGGAPTPTRRIRRPPQQRRRVHDRTQTQTDDVKSGHVPKAGCAMQGGHDDDDDHSTFDSNESPNRSTCTTGCTCRRRNRPRGKHNGAATPSRSADEVKQQVARDYDQDIVHRYSSALDILASYLKGQKIIYAGGDDAHGSGSRAS